MTSDPPLHVALGPDLHRLPVRLLYSATREDDTTFIFSHFGLFLSDAASNSHK